MKTEVKELWTGALRSDEYKQGYGRLVRVNDDGTLEHCCLGVLCDLAVKAGVEVHVSDHAGARCYDGESATLPYEVQVWAGLGGNENPLISLPDRAERFALAELNDGGYDFDYETEKGVDHWTFAQIADAIDEQL